MGSRPAPFQFTVTAPDCQEAKGGKKKKEAKGGSLALVSISTWNTKV